MPVRFDFQLDFQSRLKSLRPARVSDALADVRRQVAEGSAALQKNDPLTAERDFRLALAAEPRSIEITNDLAIALERQNRPEKRAEAISLYRRALEIKPGDAATSPLRRAIDLDAKYAPAHYELGNALARLGRTAEAARERAVRGDPERATAGLHEEARIERAALVCDKHDRRSPSGVTLVTETNVRACCDEHERSW